MTAISPVFEIATDKALPATKHTSEQVVGSYRLVAESQCDKRGGLILGDYAAAMDIGGGHAARQSLIEGIKKAQADGCAVTVSAFNHS